jgi:hypothetical protein
MPLPSTGSEAKRGSISPLVIHPSAATKCIAPTAGEELASPSSLPKNRALLFFFFSLLSFPRSVDIQRKKTVASAGRAGRAPHVHPGTGPAISAKGPNPALLCYPLCPSAPALTAPIWPTENYKGAVPLFGALSLGLIGCPGIFFPSRSFFIHLEEGIQTNEKLSRGGR